MASNTLSTLPADFLSKPAPNITANRIDFAKAGLPEYTGRYAMILDSVLDPAECEQMIKAAEATTNGEWERAMINVGGGRQKLLTDARNCGRIIWDSRDLVAKIWQRIENIPEVQEILYLEDVPRILGNGPSRRGETWKFTRPNERMRFLKYVGGEYFRPHCDGTYVTPDGKERTYFTMHLYLNNASGPSEEELADMQPKDRIRAIKSALTGGATIFHSMSGNEVKGEDKDLHVVPKCGRILLFQHRDLLHSGDDVVQGEKYTMRTDLMYTLDRSIGQAANGTVAVLPK